MRVVGGLVTTSVAVVVALSMLGVSAQDAGEYTVVLARRAAAVVFGKGVRPDLELERLELLLAKMASQLSQHQRAIARAKVELEDVESAQGKAVAGRHKLKGDLQKLRSLLAASDAADGTDATGVTITGLTVSRDKSELCVLSVNGRKVAVGKVRQAMADKLASYKQAVEQCETLERALDERRRASEKLEERLADWQSKRLQLAQRVATLKLRRQTQVLQSRTDTSVFDDADLARATTIADTVERELRVVETQQAMQSDPISELVNESVVDTSVDEDVEKILEDQL
jgi:chromosome segregation ATPase